MRKVFFKNLFFITIALFPINLLAQVSAANDQAYATIDRPLEINVLANDGLGTCTVGSITLVKASDPTHGTVEVISGNKLKYTPASGYVGQDYFTYKITCSGSTATARVDILVGRLPSNFFELNCQYRPGKFDFDLKLAYESTVNVDNYNAMAAGDLDGDGYTEIIAMVPNSTGAGTSSNHNGGSYFTSGFHIFNHKAELIKTVTFPADGAGSSRIYSTNINSITIADLNNDGKGEIVFSTMGSSAASASFKLLVYDYQGNLKATGPASAAPFRNTVGVADFDNDGYPEIYAGTSIYRYTGSSLIALYVGNTNIHSMAQDVDNDGIPEIVTPMYTYKVSLKTLTGVGSGATTNTVTVHATSGYAAAIANDQQVMALADIDLDGQIEAVVVVPTTVAPTRMNLHIWNAATGAAKYTAGVTVAGGGLGSCFPFIGDSDGDGYPDIAFMGGNSTNTAIYRFGYNGTTVVQKGVAGTGFQDFSSRVTGLTMFDFNLDNKMEIVYRDELNLYILDGTDFSVIHKEENNRSGTLREYPLIVSLTPSGESYVLINSSNTGGQIGTLRIYGSNSTPWAPSRPIWNQFAFYQNIVNDDLTVIANPLPLNFKMENDTRTIYPFNGHEVQLGPIDANTLEFVRPAPDLGLSNLKYNYNTETDVLTVTVNMLNTGDAAMDNPITVETNKILGTDTTLIQTNSCTSDLLVGIPVVYTYTIADYSSYLPLDKLEVIVAKTRIDCSMDNNSGDFSVTLKAVADQAETDVNTTKLINVIANDVLGSCTSGDIQVSVEGTPTKGTATPSGNNISYQPASNNIGAAIFRYTITCDGNSSTGRVDVSTKGYTVVDIENDAQEPTIPGKVKFFFKETGTTCDNDVKVHYTISSPGLTLGQDYTVSPASYVTILRDQTHAYLTITPINNYIVEGNRNIEVKITNVELVP